MIWSDRSIVRHQTQEGRLKLRLKAARKVDAFWCEGVTSGALHAYGGEYFKLRGRSDTQLKSV